MIRLVIISDTHSLHHGIKQKFGNLPEGDILIHAGDVSNVGDLPDIERFMNWFVANPTPREKVFIAGNHDFGFEVMKHATQTMIDELQEKHYLNYLENDGAIIDVDYESLKFWGSPVTSPFFNWAFMWKDEHRAQLWDTIPNDVDILITHSPPKDILDFSRYGSEHCGCPYLRSKVLDIKPLVHIFGHIHGEYGTHVENGTLFINASTVNERYVVTNKPIVVDIDVENRTATLVN